MADDPPLVERRKGLREAALVDEIAALRAEVARVLGENARLKSENQSLRNDVAYWYGLARKKLTWAPAASGGDSGGSPPSSGQAGP